MAAHTSEVLRALIGTFMLQLRWEHCPALLGSRQPSFDGSFCRPKCRAWPRHVHL